jgi:glycine/D-amino acid oxidase-like deaminating enzyme
MRRVVIIGGGVIGASIAFHLATDPGFAGAIIVVERYPSYARASSSLSASSIRQQFSTPVNISLSQFGFSFLQRAEKILAVDGEGPRLGLRAPGYLFLASADGAAILRENVALQRAHGADIALLDPADISARFPWLSTEGVAAGALGLSGEGWFDGPALHAAFRRKARALGVVFHAADAVGFDHDGAGKLTAVRLADGTKMPAEIAVIAAGGWSAPIAATIGIELPIRPRRRMVFVVACRERLQNCPLLIEPGGVWMRPEGDRFLCGRSPGDGEADPDEPPLEVDEAMFFDRVWPVLAARIPAFAELKLTASWAGYYDMNLFDSNGVVGRLPGVGEIFVASGFSGHGMQHAPGIGRGMAELIVSGHYRSLDLAALAPDRIVAGEKLVERNVV